MPGRCHPCTHSTAHTHPDPVRGRWRMNFSYHCVNPSTTPKPARHPKAHPPLTLHLTLFFVFLFDFIFVFVLALFIHHLRSLNPNPNQR